MAEAKLCAVEGCRNRARTRGWCAMHYKRWRRHGNPDTRRRMANGELKRWIESHSSYQGDECLIWPFWRDKYGYGPIRQMCEIAHGPPPSAGHQAAHSCGNGHEGCVHPGHLRWATRRENQADMIAHGRSGRGEKSPLAKLTEQDVREIRSMAGLEPQRVTAARYGIRHSAVGAIQRRERWGWLE